MKFTDNYINDNDECCFQSYVYGRNVPPNLSGGHGDDGCDAIKDANCEMGLDHNDPRGVDEAYRRGWIS